MVVGAALYVSDSNVSPNTYVGNERLPTGTDPFNPPSPKNPNEKHQGIWIGLLIVLILLLISIIGFILYKLHQKEDEKEVLDINSVLYSERKENEPLAQVQVVDSETGIN